MCCMSERLFGIYFLRSRKDAVASATIICYYSKSTHEVTRVLWTMILIERWRFS